MQLRYSYRLEPTPAQCLALSRTFGCARVVFNDALRVRLDAHQTGAPYTRNLELQHQVLVAAKRTTDRAFLAEVSSDALAQSVRDLIAAFTSYFRSLSGKRRGRPVGPPKFKSRKESRQTFRLSRRGFSVRGQRLFLAKVGVVRARWSRPLPASPSSVTIIRDSRGRYFASFVVEVAPRPAPGSANEIGIDLGLITYAVDSNGTQIANPRFLRKAQRRLRKAHKSLTRKQKGSNNRAKARLKLARQYARVTDIRRDWLHKTTTRLIRENQAIYLEDLPVDGLMQTRLSKSIRDGSWGKFRRMLQYKGRLYQRHVGIIGRFEPTTRKCSACGAIPERLPVWIRHWKCGCGVPHDRDENAARNILAAGRAERQNACRDHVRPPSGMAAVVEAGTEGGTRPRTSSFDGAFHNSADDLAAEQYEYH